MTEYCVFDLSVDNPFQTKKKNMTDKSDWNTCAVRIMRLKAAAIQKIYIMAD